MTAPVVTAFVLAVVGAVAVAQGARERGRVALETRRAREWDASQAGSVASETYLRLLAWSRTGSSVFPSDLVDSAVEETVTPRFAAVRFIGAAAVYGGLLGALFGLQGAVLQLGGVQKVTTQQEMESFFSTASQMLASFGSAFWAAIAGVVCTLLVNGVVAWVEREQDGFATALERTMRERMLPSLGTNDAANRATENLRAASEGLATTLVAADGAFGRSVVHLERVSSEAREVLEQGRGSLAGVRDEFVAARQGLSEALEEGARAMGAATDRAASTIGDAAAAATDRLRLEVEAAEAGKGAMEEGARHMAGAMDRMGEVLGGLSSAVQKAGEVESTLASAQVALRELAAAQRELGGNVHRSLVASQEPVVDGLASQVELMRGAFERLDLALDSHRAFVIELGEAVRDLPTSVRNEELALVGSRRLDAGVETIAALERQVAGLRSQAAQSSQATAERVEDLATRVAALIARSRVSPTDARPESPDLSAITDELGRINASIAKIQVEVERPKGIAALLGRGKG